MSNPAELLAMLAEHGINLQHVPGGIPKLVALDVAGALGMMHDEAGAAMLLAKYTMDARATSRFRDYWRRVVDRRGYVERWPVDARQELLADYSLAEWMDAQRCRTCKGVGEQMTEQGRVQVCGACEGTGLRKIGLRAPARALGLSAEGFRKSPWAPRMDWCRRELQRRELTALAGLARRMARDD